MKERLEQLRARVASLESKIEGRTRRIILIAAAGTAVPDGRYMIKPNPSKANCHSIHKLFIASMELLLPFHTKSPIICVKP